MFESGSKATSIAKKVSEDLGYSFQQMNSIAVAYNGSDEAIIKNETKLEAYNKKAREKIEEIKE